MAGRILVLDDEENYAAMLQELLREYNYRVDMATRAERAIDLLEEIPYDLVISDYKMPVMDGADFLKRARELYPNLPFILVSGLMNTPELVKVANMSVTLVMEKPLDTATFLKHVSRFSEPMTDEEKAVYAQQPEQGDSIFSIVAGIPEETRFISAGSTLSIQFMQELWADAQNGTHCFLLEPVGGEASLALKDISAWKGNHDKSVQSFALDELIDEEGVAKLQAVAEDTESSQVMLVRLNSIEQIAAAKNFAGQFSIKSTGLFIAFVVSAADCDEAFMAATDQCGLTIPPLAGRPSDVANYIQRFLRIASERLNKLKFSELSAEVSYAFLAYQWSSYSEIQDTVTQLIDEAQGATLSTDSVCTRLNIAQVPNPSERMGALLSQSQARCLLAQLHRSEATVEEFSKSLDCAAVVDSEAKLREVPLLDADLASF